MGQCRVQGDGAAGFGRGDLGPRHSHSHSLGLRISIYAFDPKNSSRLRILGPLSTSNSRYDPKCLSQARPGARLGPDSPWPQSMSPGRHATGFYYQGVAS